MYAMTFLLWNLILEHLSSLSNFSEFKILKAYNWQKFSATSFKGHAKDNFLQKNKQKNPFILHFNLKFLRFKNHSNDPLIMFCNVGKHLAITCAT